MEFIPSGIHRKASGLLNHSHKIQEQSKGKFINRGAQPFSCLSSSYHFSRTHSHWSLGKKGKQQVWLQMTKLHFFFEWALLIPNQDFSLRAEAVLQRWWDLEFNPTGSENHLAESSMWLGCQIQKRMTNEGVNRIPHCHISISLTCLLNTRDDSVVAVKWALIPLGSGTEANLYASWIYKLTHLQPVCAETLWFFLPTEKTWIDLQYIWIL